MNVRATWKRIRVALKGLHERDLDPDPIRQFRKWFEEARKARLYLPEAIALATTTAEGRPSARMMLFKDADERGFVFYTNFESRKADELKSNPYGVIISYWGELARQVRIEGRVERIPEEESTKYFGTRPRGSQIGAWASEQSAIIENRKELEMRVRKYREQFHGQEVPLPPFWGGYRLIPDRIEFWQGRADRLHDRLCYIRENGSWKIVRLSP